MIKGLMGSRGIAVNGGNTSVPYVPQNNSNPIQGMIRIWGSDMQVFDGSSWMNLSSSYATVELDTETIMLLEWARKKKVEEELLMTMPSDHPAVKAAKQNLNKVKLEVRQLEEQLKITEILSKDEQPTS
jgi:hypothetical protein